MIVVIKNTNINKVTMKQATYYKNWVVENQTCLNNALNHGKALK